MSIVLLCIGVLILANGAYMCVAANLNLGVVLTVFLGAFFMAWGIFYEKIRAWTSKGFWKWVKILALAVLCVEIVLVGFIAVYGQWDNVDYKEEAVIVLGAGVHGDQVSLPLKMRLNAAVNYHKRNPDALIVVSGGQGFQETVTEASAMEKYLLAKGVLPERIIKEEKATSTAENMRFSKEILDAEFDGAYKVVVVTNNFHIYRGTQIAKAEGFEHVAHLHAGLQWYNLLPCYLRESLAVLKLWIIG